MTLNFAQDSPCPCGSGQTYGRCCQPSHRGRPALTVEALMRSRYTAYKLGLSDYLLQTWHPSRRPAALKLTDAPLWASLQVLSAEQKGDQGQVRFRAIYRAGDSWGFLEELSDFVREAGRWYYVTGVTREGPLKPGRNDQCPCGSGRKFKACCL